MLTIDSGNFSDNPTPEGNLKTAALLEAMGRLGYSVVNVGERDVRNGYADFVRRTEDTEFTFVSANIVRQGTEEPVFRPSAVLEATSRDGSVRRRGGVVGAVRYNPIFLKAGPEKTNMVIDQPLKHVRREVQRLRDEGVDAVVLLAALHKQDAKTIAQQVDGIDYVLGSYGGAVTAQPEVYGGTSVVYCGNRGQRLIEARLFLEDEQEDVTRIHFLNQDYPHDQEMLDFVNSISLSEAAQAAPSDTGRPSS